MKLGAELTPQPCGLRSQPRAHTDTQLEPVKVLVSLPQKIRISKLGKGHKADTEKHAEDHLTGNLSVDASDEKDNSDYIIIHEKSK